MKTGFSSNAYTYESLSYAISSISKIGYDGIELVLDKPHIFLPIKKSEINSIKKDLKKYDIRVTNLNANTVSGWYKENTKIEKFEPSLSNNNEKLRRWRIEYIKKAIDIAQELEAPSICITSGIYDNGERKQHLINFERSLEEISAYSENKQVLIGIEYEPGLVIDSFQNVIPFITKFKNVGVNYDICHAQVNGENIPTNILKLNKKLLHIHLSDCKNRNHYHLIPGFGDVNFEGIFKTLKKINYRGYLTAELYTYSSAPDYAAKLTFGSLKRLVN